MNYLEKVKEFHRAFDVGINQEAIPDLIKLRKDLIVEECGEVVDEFYAETLDKKKLTKELSDLIYVAVGAAIHLGLPLNEVFEAVHASNMSKLGENGKPVLREDGKILKGPNYKEPNLDQFFKE